MILLLLILSIQVVPMQSTCQNCNGVCYSASNNKCHLSTADQHNTKQKCEAKSSSWCGTDVGRMSCAAALQDSQTTRCEGCPGGICINLAEQESGTDVNGAIGKSGSYGRWCSDTLLGSNINIGCTFECTNGARACKSSSFWCGNADSGNCNLMCENADSGPACQATSLHCGNNKDCKVTCKGNQACLNLQITCPDAPYKCEVYCDPSSGAVCESMTATNCGNANGYNLIADNTEVLPNCRLDLQKQNTVQECSQHVMASVQCGSRFEWNKVNKRCSCQPPKQDNSPCATRSDNDVAMYRNTWERQVFEDNTYRWKCNEPTRSGRLCTNVANGQQLYLHEETGACVDTCPDSSEFHITSPLHEYARSCGPCPKGELCPKYYGCQANKCIEKGFLNNPKADPDCCSTSLQARCAEGYTKVALDPGGVKCAGNQPVTNYKIYTTCCQQQQQPQLLATCTSIDDIATFCDAGNGLIDDALDATCAGVTCEKAVDVGTCCKPVTPTAPWYDMMASGTALALQHPLLEGGNVQSYVIGPAVGIQLAPGSYVFTCDGSDSSPTSNLYVALSSKNTAFVSTTLTVRMELEVQTSASWRIDVRSPLDTNNDDPTLRNATLNCVLSESNVVVGKISKSLAVRNVVRPSVRDAYLSFVGSKGTVEDAVVAANFEDSVNQVNSSGILDIAYSSGALLRLRPHLDFGLSQAFVSTKVYLTDDAKGKSSDKYYKEMELNEENVFISPDGKNIYVKIPEMKKIPKCLSGLGKTSCEICHLGLKLENQLDPDSNSGNNEKSPGSIFRCPPESNTSNTCLLKETEVLLKSTFDPTILQLQESKRWSVRYLPKCDESIYKPPGSKACAETIETAQTCAFGLCDQCIACPKGGNCIQGGFNIIAFPGFYVNNSIGQGEVSQCPFPALERCIGSNQCGEAYAGIKCKICNSSYYSTPDLTCEKCPTSEKTYDALLASLLPFIGVLTLSSIIMCLLVWYLEHQIKARLKPACKCCPCLPAIAIRQTKEFTIWVVLSAQVMASASSSPLPGLPFWILDVYSVVSFFNLDSSYSLPQECLDGSSPFTQTYTILSGILALTLIQAAIFAVGLIYRLVYDRDSASKDDMEDQSTLSIVCAEIQGKLFVVLSFGFPLVTKNVFKMLHCEMDENNVNVLAWSGERIECYVGEHANVAILSWLVITFYMVMYPICTFAYLHLRIIPAIERTGDAPLDFCHDKEGSIQSQKSKARLSRWDHFITDDYSPKHFYFRHIYYIVTILMFAVYEHIDRSEHGGIRCCLIVFMFVVYLALLFWKRPFNDLEYVQN